MSGNVDFQEVKKAAPFEQVLAKYGLTDKLTRKGQRFIGLCPIHGGKNNVSQFHVDLEKGRYRCFSPDCGPNPGGDVIQFVSKMEKVGLRQAALKLKDWFLAGPPQIPPTGGNGGSAGEEKATGTEFAEKRTLRTPEPSVTVAAQGEGNPRTEEDSRGDNSEESSPADNGSSSDRVNPPLTFQLKNLAPDHPYLKQRGLADETIKTFGLGYAKRGLLKGRIAIPWHDEQGNLIAYVGRATTEEQEKEGKYKIPAGFKKSLSVWNLNRAKEYSVECGLIVVEGFFGCMWLWQLGYRNVCALIGADMSEAQGQLISNAVGPDGWVTLLLDGDEAGKKGAVQAAGILLFKVGGTFVRVMTLDRTKYQPDHLTEKDLESLLGTPIVH